MKVMQVHSWLLLSEWRARFMQITVVVITIAIGVALGFSIHLINTAAFNEFSAASKSLSGQSDLQVHSKQGFFDELLYPRLAQFNGVELANPVLEFTVAVPSKQEDQNNRRLTIVGIDMFRAADISPDLLGVPADDQLMDGLSDNAIFLSPAAMQWLQVEQGDMLQLNVGAQVLTLRVAGGVTRARAGHRIAVMDIGAAQWRFNYLGLLSRIELKLDSGVHHQFLKQQLEQQLGEQFFVTEAEDQEARVAMMSRGYRVNLNMLALVALFTGAFLVFSTQALSVVRRRSQIALLRVLGYTRSQLLQQLIVEGIVLGVIGSLAGLVLGYGFAVLVIQLLGGDLGSSFFPDIQPQLHISPVAVIAYFLIGLSVTLLGSILPAIEAVRVRPAEALRSGSEDRAINPLKLPWPAIVCLVVAALMTQLPPVYELPVFGYLAIALLLIGGIAIMPSLAAWVFSDMQHVVKWVSGRSGENIVAFMVLARLTNAPNQAAVALSGVLASFSLMVAMATMVMSFRVSVHDWLEHVLPADIYVRAADRGDQGGFLPEEQKKLAALSVFSKTNFFRYRSIVLDPERPEITLIARSIDTQDPSNTLPLVGESVTLAELPSDTRPLWVSEAMVDLYGYTVGKRVKIPVGTDVHDFIVAGVWRDYGRQFGAIQLQLSDYQALTGDLSINTVALWMQPQVTFSEIQRVLQQLSFGETLEITQSQAIRTKSIALFDRSFAVTYLLEIAAVLIGLLGVATSFSAQVLARIKEFGMLRHIGVTRNQILTMLAIEGSFVSTLGITLGFILGLAISLILIFIVNPQSFHWTMELTIPWFWLTLIAGLMLISASITALIAGRRSISGNVVRAVREDW